MGPLSALVKAYDDRRRWTLELPRLGCPEAVRGKFGGAILPMPPISKITPQNKDPHIICLELDDETGEIRLHPLAGPVSWPAMRRLTKYLVAMGAHPLDIIVATWNGNTDDFTFRSSVDHLLWTAEDQEKLYPSVGGDGA